jgi:uncharacterized protein (TIGR02145 family)
MKQRIVILLAVFLFCVGLTGLRSQTVTDSRDGNVYQTVTIGTQVWMAENLKYLPSVIGPATGSQTTPYYYVYGYYGTVVADAKATANYTTYGVLYNWPAAMNGAASSTANPSGVQGVCPTGWHLPSDAEWTQLNEYVGATGVGVGKLKETGTSHWISPNTAATNETGFTALPGGSRNFDGPFIEIGRVGFWWAANEISDVWAGRIYLAYDTGDIRRRNFEKEAGFSVRCLLGNSTSINITENSEEEIFYPNPSIDKLYFKNSNYTNGIIMIFDLQGKQVLSKQIDSDPIDISDLEKGIYVVKLVCSENVLITKFIKE